MTYLKLLCIVPASERLARETNPRTSIHLLVSIFRCLNECEDSIDQRFPKDTLYLAKILLRTIGRRVVTKSNASVRLTILSTRSTVPLRELSIMPARRSARSSNIKIETDPQAVDAAPTPTTKKTATKGQAAKGAVKANVKVKPPVSANTSRKRKRVHVEEENEDDTSNEDENMDNIDVKSEPSENETNIRDVEPVPKGGKAKTGSAKTSARKAKAKKVKPSEKDLEAGADLAASKLGVPKEELSSPTKKAKANPYGLSPGESPFPTYSHPTPAECREVNDILTKVHGAVTAPKTIPTPSLNTSGCGEVPSVLDALVRTRLSAATNNQNSSRAFRGLVETFGIIERGIGKGSVDWDKVRKAPQKEVFEAIKSGGLADVKSRDIQKILNMVYLENQERKTALVKDEDNAGVQSEEIKRTESAVLSLDHLHEYSSEDAFSKLLGYPGVGPKTASCVLLFCMQRPSFAVDTHVFRLTRWLGWTPSDQQARGMFKRGEAKTAQVTRNSTYAHCEVRVPDDLKYALHYLLIKHGKVCGWCSAMAGKDKKVGACALAALMKGKGSAKGSAKKVKEDEKTGEPIDENGDQEEGENGEDDPEY